MSYPLFRLGTVAEIEREGVHPQAILSGTKYVGLEHIGSNGGFVATPTVHSGDLASSKFAFSKKHILFGKLRPYLRKIARPEFSGICSTDIVPIAPKEKLNRDYLFHFLRTDEVIERASALATGVNLPRLSPKQLMDFEIPVPPLDEQRRIAMILDQADTLRRKRREAITKLGELRRSVFDHFFGNPSSNPKAWLIGRISDVTSTTQYGASAKAGDVGKFPILRMGNITSEGDWKLDDLKYIDLKTNDVGKYTVRTGDILFNRTNSPELVGKTAVFRESQPYAFAGYLVRLRLNNRSHPEYVSAYLNSVHGKATLRGMCKSIIGMANINAKELVSIPLMLPPMATQEEYADVVSASLMAEKSHNNHLKQLDTLFASLQHRAFRGEL